MIPVFEPEIGDAEIQSVVEALKKGEISGTFGETLPRFEQNFADYCGVKHGIAVSSGTTALQLAVAAAGIGEGDEVLVSACTNIATALAVYHNGAVTVPVDSESKTWNMDLDIVESLITDKTKAILPVHIYGHPVDMDRVCEIAEKHKLIVIEDCAESHGATCRGKTTGGFGLMGCFSFYANKIITTGEGGMVITNDDDVAQRLRDLRNLAFGTPRFYHQKAGYNYRMTGYQAGMGLAQLAKIESIIESKRNIARTYNEILKDIPGLRLPQEASWAKNVYWMYGLIIDPDFGMSRDELMTFLRQNDIGSRTFFCPMNQQPFIREQDGYRDVQCPVADKLWENGLYIPSGTTLKESDIQTVADTILQAHQKSQ